MTGGWWRADRDGPGRVVASLAVAAFLAVTAVQNFWYVPGARRVEPRLRPLRQAGIEQGWGMFVFRPDAPPTAQVLRARLTYADGSVRAWRPPQDARFAGAQRAARWQKYAEFARPRSHGEGGGAGQELWAPLARWLARTQRGSTPVVRVELVAVDLAIPDLGDRGPRSVTETVVHV